MLSGCVALLCTAFPGLRSRAWYPPGRLSRRAFPGTRNGAADKARTAPPRAAPARPEEAHNLTLQAPLPTQISPRAQPLMSSPLKDLQTSTCSVITHIQRLTTDARANCPWGTAEAHFTLPPVPQGYLQPPGQIPVIESPCKALRGRSDRGV